MNPIEFREEFRRRAAAKRDQTTLADYHDYGLLNGRIQEIVGFEYERRLIYAWLCGKPKSMELSSKELTRAQVYALRELLLDEQGYLTNQGRRWVFDLRVIALEEQAGQEKLL